VNIASYDELFDQSECPILIFTSGNYTKAKYPIIYPRTEMEKEMYIIINVIIINIIFINIIIIIIIVIINLIVCDTGAV